MLGTIPTGGFTKTGNATVQAVTTSIAQLNFRTPTALPGTGDRVGDPAVKPDVTNNRVQVNTPGIYEVTFSASGVAASTLLTTFDVRKGDGTTQTAITGAKIKQSIGTANQCVSLTSQFEIRSSDLPAAGGAKTFDDPSAAAGAGKPAGGFAGAGAAPKTGIYIDIGVTGDGSVNLTLSEMFLQVKRIG